MELAGGNRTVCPGEGRRAKRSILRRTSMGETQETSVTQEAEGGREEARDVVSAVKVVSGKGKTEGQPRAEQT